MRRVRSDRGQARGALIALAALFVILLFLLIGLGIAGYVVFSRRREAAVREMEQIRYLAEVEQQLRRAQAEGKSGDLPGAREILESMDPMLEDVERREGQSPAAAEKARALRAELDAALADVRRAMEASPVRPLLEASPAGGE